MIPRYTAAGTASASKPRASGDDPKHVPNATLYRIVNPARAGMIPVPPVHEVRLLRKPRASGDDPRLARPSLTLNQ